MYLRHTTVTKNGKTHTYWRLVRSVRNGTKVRQETVLQLGELDEQGRIRARALSQSFLGVEGVRQSLEQKVGISSKFLVGQPLQRASYACS